MHGVTFWGWIWGTCSRFSHCSSIPLGSSTGHSSSMESAPHPPARTLSGPQCLRVNPKFSPAASCVSSVILVEPLLSHRPDLSVRAHAKSRPAPGLCTCSAFCMSDQHGSELQDWHILWSPTARPGEVCPPGAARGCLCAHCLCAHSLLPENVGSTRQGLWHVCNHDLRMKEWPTRPCCRLWGPWGGPGPRRRSWNTSTSFPARSLGQAGERGWRAALTSP